MVKDFLDYLLGFLDNLVSFKFFTDGTKFCKKYSNGYMEQWADGIDSFIFIVPFKDINYSYSIARIKPFELKSGIDKGINVNSKTKNGIYIDSVYGGEPKVMCRIFCQGYWK